MDANIIFTVIFTATNIAQFFLAIIAIGLSVLFFISAKKAEKETAKSLEAIRAQAETLKDITSKQMTRLIKNVTEQKPIEDMLTIFSSLSIFPQHNNELLQLKEQEIKNLTHAAIEGFIGAYYYAAVTNFLAKINLPAVGEYDPDNQTDVLVKGLVDMSAKDFNNIKTILETVERGTPDRITNNNAQSYYLDGKSQWAPLVMDSGTYFADREQQKQN